MAAARACGVQPASSISIRSRTGSATLLLPAQKRFNHILKMAALIAIEFAGAPEHTRQLLIRVFSLYILADQVFTDPPYNVPIDGHVGGSGAVKHREFAMAAG